MYPHRNLLLAVRAVSIALGTCGAGSLARWSDDYSFFCLSCVQADFKRHYREGENALRTVVLINCGAAEDVRALLDLYDRPNVRIVIVDSHR